MVQDEGKILTFKPSRLPENGSPILKREGNSFLKNIKMKVTLIKKVSKGVRFTDFFLHACSMYSHFEFELKK